MRLFVVLWNWKNLINVCVDFIPTREWEEKERCVCGIKWKLCRQQGSVAAPP